jgi:alpha-glucosidase/alpha-D-xyloside xylohydrolase
MPLYVRAGAIIPFDPVRQYTGEVVREPTTLKVYGGTNGDFTLYEDDGISQEYLKGKGSWIKISWDEKRKRLTLRPNPPKGAVNGTAERTFNVELIPQRIIKHINYAGKPVNVYF